MKTYFLIYAWHALEISLGYGIQQILKRYLKSS